MRVQASDPEATVTCVRNAVWTISNLCRGKRPPRWELVAPALPMLIHWIRSCDDEEVITDCCWALSYISDPSERVQLLIDAGALPQLIVLLGHSSSVVQAPALRAVGNAAAGSAAQAQAVLGCNVIAKLHGLLRSPKKDLRKESCWIISNLTAGSAEQVGAVWAAGLLPVLLEMVATEEYEIKKEAAYCIVNAICNACSTQLIVDAVQLGALGALCELLDLSDAALILAALEAIDAILRAGDLRGGGAPNKFTRITEACGGLGKLEQLQMHANNTVYRKTAALLETYFTPDDGDEDPAIAPQALPDQFCFGAEPRMEP
uniref:Importin subunit alpha n=1 Tax=Calcidiscus leptoporus TaxID=127549 RepID=A0A7S0NW61_9EUKA|mmetsp:Transcript_28757/g.67429  ORF Transcript_28757/g.67429 Transcript_28757/m.67429 type:complete len:318 (+) Transcript_28757:395-1348(+)